MPAALTAHDTTSRTRRSGRHRAAKTVSPMRVGALVAFAGAIGLTFGGAGQAAAHPAAPTAPANVASPVDLDLPPEIDDLVRGLLPPSGLAPGQNRAVAPAKGTVTSGYGARWGTNHNGVDIANKIGTPVHAVTDGTVLESGPASGFGQWIRVKQDDGTVGVFGHVDKSFVKAGQQVRAGQTIGTVGNRGHSTGPHLHYEVRDAKGSALNPHAWLAKRGVHL
ncbi:hypothetical protein GCM10022231_17270 [Gordonia caeni]|uniref:M23ase beta-sheet core domain-containing protein n=1 Tax=Gordonia caeni TaxID=1007097 RepID=A0ABP7P1T3_9ACTN